MYQLHEYIIHWGSQKWPDIDIRFKILICCGVVHACVRVIHHIYHCPEYCSRKIAVSFRLACLYNEFQVILDYHMRPFLKYQRR